MNLLAGLNKVVTIVFMLALATINVGCSDAHKQICMGDDFVLTYVTPTIQTVAIYSKQYGGKHRLIRGRIEFMSVNHRYIAGYLSTRFFEEDRLIDLAEENDREGFFIVNKLDANVLSGIDGKTFFNVMEKQYGDKLIKFIKPNQASDYGSCQP